MGDAIRIGLQHFIRQKCLIARVFNVVESLTRIAIICVGIGELERSRVEQRQEPVYLMKQRFGG